MRVPNLVQKMGGKSNHTSTISHPPEQGDMCGIGGIFLSPVSRGNDEGSLAPHWL